MKKYALILTCAAACAALTGCEDVSDRMSSDYPSTYDIKYGIRQVLQYDPMNINGIDVAEKFDFFGTLRFTIHVKDNRMASLEFSNGDVPFSPYAFEIPSGEVECYLDTEALPCGSRGRTTSSPTSRTASSRSRSSSTARSSTTSTLSRRLSNNLTRNAL